VQLLVINHYHDRVPVLSAVIVGLKLSAQFYERLFTQSYE